MLLGLILDNHSQEINSDPESMNKNMYDKGKACFFRFIFCKKTTEESRDRWLNYVTPKSLGRV